VAADTWPPRVPFDSFRSFELHTQHVAAAVACASARRVEPGANVCRLSPDRRGGRRPSSLPDSFSISRRRWGRGCPMEVTELSWRGLTSTSSWDMCC
jgi:hypothetical protein